MNQATTTMETTAPVTTNDPVVKLWSPSNPQELLVINTESGSDTRVLISENEFEHCNSFERRALRSLVNVAEERTATTFSSSLEISKNIVKRSVFV